MPLKPGEVVADSGRFDQRIRLLVPRYDEFHQAVLRSIPPEFKGSVRVLELGCGTGELTQRLLERFPYAQVYAVDYSAKMLAVARHKLAAHADRLQLIEGDFNVVELPPQLDLVLSTLAIHHLTDPDKLRLFQRVFQHLSEGGWFVNGDAVLFESVHHEYLHQVVRREHAEAQNMTLEALAQQLEEQGHDHPATLIHQLHLLQAAGFSVVDVIWKYYSLAVFGGFKGKLPALPTDPSLTFAY
ncbi:MAG TPA: class I SAM-dependent methyltransferase [Candidatus Bipolaricaulota bacterium]